MRGRQRDSVAAAATATHRCSSRAAEAPSSCAATAPPLSCARSTQPSAAACWRRASLPTPRSGLNCGRAPPSPPVCRRPSRGSRQSPRRRGLSLWSSRTCLRACASRPASTAERSCPCGNIARRRLGILGCIRQTPNPKPKPEAAAEEATAATLPSISRSACGSLWCSRRDPWEWCGWSRCGPTAPAATCPWALASRCSCSRIQRAWRS
mmetsp:Transcript_24668/g.60666  ORF Transcript_24668/g.60666 Transcript_24668/m.60666 type:complete len:209 (+) Transcript_24668:159-785(+)